MPKARRWSALLASGVLLLIGLFFISSGIEDTHIHPQIKLQVGATLSCFAILLFWYGRKR